MQTYIS